MEFARREIHRSSRVGEAVSQITLEEDLIVTDSKEDVEEILHHCGSVEIQDKRLSGGKYLIKGALIFQMLYHTLEGKGIDHMEGTLPFEEGIHVENLNERDEVRVMAELEELNISLIHSRKIHVKAIVTLTLWGERLTDVSMATGALDTETQVIAAPMTPLQLLVMTKDIFRIREEVELSSSKPNIEELFWNNLALRGMECRPLDGKLSLHGELELFTIYRAQEDHIPLQWLERSIPFSGVIEVEACKDGMIPDIDIRLTDTKVEIKEDYDGEKRMLEVEGALEMTIRLYEEIAIERIEDIYCPGSDLKIEEEKEKIPFLIIHNTFKHRVQEKLSLPDPEKILQICHTEGILQVQEKEPVEDGLSIQGTLSVSILYVTGDDTSPLRCMKGEIPISFVADAPGIKTDDLCRVKPRIEQLTAMPLGSGEAEVKAVLEMECLVVREEEVSNIRQAIRIPFDPDKLEQMPGMIGYVVQEGDTLWKIAKKYYLPVDAIERWNETENGEIQPGDRLILVKQPVH